jgi:hypothetical protein
MAVGRKPLGACGTGRRVASFRPCEEAMPVYRLIPAADAADSNWDRAINQGEVVVRANSTGEARALAALAEAQAAGAAVASTQVSASALMDDKLYTVREEPPGQWPEGADGVLEAKWRFTRGYVPADD